MRTDGGIIARPSGRARERRVLISTLAPGPGGVSAMTRFVVSALASQGLQPVIAHYAPYRKAPHLSVPSFKLLQQRPGAETSTAYEGTESHAIGAWLPELEFTHYWPTQHWRDLIDSCDAYVAVSGNALAATPFLKTGKPFLAWVATDWEGDRSDRVRQFPWLRRLLDTLVVAPVARRLEADLLRAGHVLPLSEFTARMLARISKTPVSPVTLPVCIDVETFRPDPTQRVPRRIGFAGRYSDPRKNIGLLLETVARLRSMGKDVTAVLVGDQPCPETLTLVQRLGIGDSVSFHDEATPAGYADLLRSFDIFVLPSHQEGLCIAALEAMACGIPVVSTRCGGPEEFVLPGTTGALVDPRGEDMAQAVCRILDDPALRERLSQGAVHQVRSRYTHERAEALFLSTFHSVFPRLRMQPALKYA